MELSNMKQVWLRIGPPQSAQDIGALIRKRSVSLISAIKRSLMFECALVLLLYGGAAFYYFTAYDGRLSAFSWFMITVACFFILYYYIKYRLLARMQRTTWKVASSVRNDVDLLRRYIRFYCLAGTLLAPVACMFIAWIIYVEQPIDATNSFFHPLAVPTWLLVACWLAATAILTAIFFVANKWYVHRLYGKYLEKLYKVLEDIDEPNLPQS